MKTLSAVLAVLAASIMVGAGDGFAPGGSGGSINGGTFHDVTLTTSTVSGDGSGLTNVTATVTPPSIHWVTGNYAILKTDSTLIFTNGAATNILTLPSTVGATNVFNIKNISISPGGYILTNATGSQNIEAALSLTNLTRFSSVTVQSDGTNWWVY